VSRRALLVIFLGATLLGIFSAIQAYNYVALFSEKPQPTRDPAGSQHVVLVRDGRCCRRWCCSWRALSVRAV
jgi:hypothetical protein